MMYGCGVGRGAGTRGPLGTYGAAVKDLECHLKVLLWDKFPLWAFEGFYTSKRSDQIQGKQKEILCSMTANPTPNCSAMQSTYF